MRRLCAAVAVALPLSVLVGVLPAIRANATPTPFIVTSLVDAPHDTGAVDGCTSDLPDHACTLRAALQAAAATAGADTIDLPAGTFDLVLTGSGEDAGKTGDLDVSAGALTIVGQGPGATIIHDAFSLADPDRIFDVRDYDAPLTLQGLTLRPATTPAGGQGSAIRSQASSLTLDDVEVSGGTGASLIAAGGAFATSTLTLSNGTEIHGAVVGGSVVQLAMSNTSSATTADLEVHDASLHDNTVAGTGSIVDVSLTDSTQGGTLTANLTGSSLATNTATTSTVSLTPAGAGTTHLAASVDTSSFFDDVIAASGTPTGKSAGLYVASGGWDAGSTLAVTRSTFASDQSAIAGAIEADGGNVTITNSTFDGNQSKAGVGAAGAISFAGTALTVSHATISGGGTNASGAHISASRPHAVGPTGPAATAGISVRKGTATVTSTIVATGSANSCVVAASGATLTSGGTNIDGGTSCGFTTGSDHSSTDPMLGPLANNGGPTQTREPQAGSPALDVIPLPCTGTDQIGRARPQGSGCDVGAVERTVAASSPSPSPSATAASPSPSASASSPSPTSSATTSTSAGASPSSTPSPTPRSTSSTTPKPPRIPTTAEVLTGLPKSKSCVVKKQLLVHLHVPKGLTLAKVTIVVGKHKVTRTGKHITAGLDLRPFTTSHFTVAVTMSTKGGKSVTAKRSYRLCT